MVLTTVVRGIPSVFVAEIPKITGKNSARCAGNNPVMLTNYGANVLLDKTVTCDAEEEAHSTYTIMLLQPGVYQDSKNYDKGATKNFMIIIFYMHPGWEVNQSTMTYGFFRTVYNK